MPLPNRGSVEWFSHQRGVVLRDARALDSIAAAHRLAVRLNEAFETMDAEINSSLLSTICINYARPFSQTPAYPVRALKRQPQFDVEVHNHLLELRHKLIAHSDENYADATMHTAILRINHKSQEGVATTISIPQSLHVRVVALDSIHSIELSKRFCDHIQAASSGATNTLEAHLEDFLSAAIEFGDNYQEASRLSRLKTGSKSKSLGPFDMSNADKVLLQFDQLKDPHKLPPLQMGKDGYNYRTFEVMHAATGEIVARFGNDEFKLEVSAAPKASDVSDT